ncbi:SCP-like extracellular [Emticicia oligotrophica DSM 17448]|uniref:SCP-like extracellular n=1 Tax=Emticicia oligotrophica (strain DSM 17448 / CIP 109782 / MTCC 6937 / GPTSA100-15) TaxID=929562 RepID=A0ABM5MZ31_EMTOG|nr:CAP domain-containing protein [Emticicia oligotrophica]AFK02424.1 SCP-like extracellular [Emticicia oligotrophica DSM 17448]
MMKSCFVFTFCVFILLSHQACSQSPEQINGETQLEQSVLDYVNQHRRGKGLAPLKMMPIITAEALKHSKNMADGRVDFGHDGFEGRADRLMSQIEQSNAISENVAYGKFTAQEVVNRWLQSAGHRKNIEGKFNLTGIGIVRRNDGYIYFTQIFLNK